jgi:surfeit locus 1 family protein
MELRKNYTFGSFRIRINWLLAACVVITAATFMRLGLWQLDRAAEKVDAQNELLAELQINAEPIESIPPGHLHAANPELQNRHVKLVGEYWNERTILLLAEFYESQIGYGVVTPLRLSSNNRLVLVHRGWTTGILPPDTPPFTRPVTGPVEIDAQIFVPSGNIRAIENTIDASQWPLRIRTLDVDTLSAILGEPLFPFTVRITADQPGTLTRHWPAVQPAINQNLSYAVQWFSFGLAVLFIALLASSNLWILLKGTDPAVADTADSDR